MFRIFKSLGKSRYVFIDEAATPEDALARIKAFAELWPGDYIVKNQDGEQV